MLRKITLVLLALLLAVVPLAACQSGTTPPSVTSSQQPSETQGSSESGGAKSYETITWPSIIPVYSQTGGTAYTLNGAFLDLATKYMPGVSFVSEGTSGALEMMNLLEERAQSGKAAISFTSSDSVYMARRGEGPYETPLTEVYQASFMTATEHWLTTPTNSGIKTLADVRGKRIGVGPVGSALCLLSEVLLNEAGVTFDDFEPYYVGFEGSNSGMVDGSLDGGFYGGPPPFAQYEDLATSLDITAIGISDEAADSILARYPFSIKKTVPAGIMEGVDEDISVLCIVTMINMNSAISEELGYAILEMLFDHLEEFRPYHPRALENFTVDNWHLGICSDVHPGAIKFFTEQGVYNK